MKIKTGKYYRTRDGQKVGPMRVFCTDGFDVDETINPKDVDTVWWLGNGRQGGTQDGEINSVDLIAEWRDEPDLTAPDYNDGKWHGWNGGKCPVDPRATVDVVWDDSGLDADRIAGEPDWSHDREICNIIAFRVTKPAPPKPRELWIEFAPDGRVWHVHTDGNPQFINAGNTCTLWREADLRRSRPNE